MLLPRRQTSVYSALTKSILAAIVLTVFAEVAKDSDAGMGTRAEAAKDAVGDKAKETKHTVRVSSLLDFATYFHSD